jgi:hypothetical protein
MTVSVTGYADKYFETNISVHPCDIIVNTLTLEIVDQSFSMEEFNVTLFVHNSTDFGIEGALIQAWWNGMDVSADVKNLGGGFYFISLNPITVLPGEVTILLNITVSAIGYADRYFETNISVHPCDITVDTLNLEIVDQSFSKENFNITLFLFNSTGSGIDFATFEIWWNGTDVSTGVQNLGSGYYFISLNPITVLPGEDPILLNLNFSAPGFEEGYFETSIAVDPNALQKGTGGPTGEFPWMMMIIVLSISLGALIGLISLWLRRRKIS